MTKENRFVVEGYSRARLAIESEIRALVVAEYSAKIDGASFWRRFRLRRAIEREVRLRLAKAAPPDGLY